MGFKNWEEIVNRAAAEVELWWAKQCRNTSATFFWWYLPSSTEHDGGFLIAETNPANPEYQPAGELRKDWTREQNLWKFLESARQLPILAWQRDPISQEKSASVKVIFRKFKIFPKDVLAVFPDIEADQRGNLFSYQHVGQHGSCSRDFFSFTTAAKKEDYADLQKELESIGYVLDVRKRR